jgi:hypothetical protein
MQFLAKYADFGLLSGLVSAFSSSLPPILWAPFGLGDIRAGRAIGVFIRISGVQGLSARSSAASALPRVIFGLCLSARHRFFDLAIAHRVEKHGGGFRTARRRSKYAVLALFLFVGPGNTVSTKHNARSRAFRLPRKKRQTIRNDIP